MNRKTLTVVTVIGVMLIVIGVALTLRPSIICVITNISSREINDVHIVGPGCDKRIGSIAAGQKRQVRCRVQRDGVMKASFIREGSNDVTSTIGVYVTPGLGGHIHVTIDDVEVATEQHLGVGIGYPCSECG